VGIVKVAVAHFNSMRAVLFSRLPLLDGRFISGKNFSQVTSGQLVILKDGLLVGGMIRKIFFLRECMIRKLQ
jgi:hypothetical protein